MESGVFNSNKLPRSIPAGVCKAEIRLPAHCTPAVVMSLESTFQSLAKRKSAWTGIAN
ncbi:hypothetical protein [Candidatus Dactylopiibacterium carminicum]|uniref:hypothetical protein n=1 Tax=Candidatus Dactylopiibacterium carminicum TaxID=857335 RepID=UPI0014835588|nr:hypothetical protein [Candidatus Dactylopiibacterium carminicum]